MRAFRWLIVIALAAASAWLFFIGQEKNLRWTDLLSWLLEPGPIGKLDSEPLTRLGLTPEQVRQPSENASFRYVGLAPYLNGAKAVVTHSVDDTHPDLPKVIDKLDRHGVKATFFISTRRGPIGELWPILARAARNGHEIGSHARTHPCQFPPDMTFCLLAYSSYELEGSRDDILAHVDQRYVWAFAYPCGQCFQYTFVRRKLKHAGYLVARGYPDEETGGHLVPDLQSFAPDPYHAAYTQVVQKQGGPVAPSGRTNVDEINGKFDKVYRDGGIYHFVTHPQWLDFDPDGFYERHLEHVAKHDDIWYVPLGPLYAFHRVRDATRAYPLGDNRVAVAHNLSPNVYPNSVTLEFEVEENAMVTVISDDRRLGEKPPGPTVGWEEEYYRQEGGRLWVTIRPNAILSLTVKSR